MPKKKVSSTPTTERTESRLLVSYAFDLARKLNISRLLVLADLLQDLLEPSTVEELAAPLNSKDERRHLARALYVGVETGVWVVDGASP